MSRFDKTAKVKLFFEQPQSYLHRTFGVKLRAHLAYRLLLDEKKTTLLDIGCGEGSISLQFLHKAQQLTLIDLSEPMLALAKQNAPSNMRDRIDYLNVDFLDYQSEQKFDVILCFGVLAHVTSIERVISRIATFLNPGGICLLQFSDNAQWLTRLHHLVGKLRNRATDKYGYSLNRINYSDLLSLCQKSNLQLLDIQRYSLILPGMGVLPDQFLYQLQRISQRTPWLSKHGSDVVLKLEKVELTKLL